MVYLIYILNDASVYHFLICLSLHTCAKFKFFKCLHVFYIFQKSQKRTENDFIFGKLIGEGSFSSVSIWCHLLLLYRRHYYCSIMHIQCFKYIKVILLINLFVFKFPIIKSSISCTWICRYIWQRMWTLIKNMQVGIAITRMLEVNFIDDMNIVLTIISYDELQFQLWC